MPRYEDYIPINDLEPDVALAFAYDTLLRLQWEVVLAGNDTLLGHTPGSWRSKGQQIICTVSSAMLHVVSETVSRDLPDISAIHKRNVELFIQKFNEVKSTITDEIIATRLQDLSELRNVSKRNIEQQHAAFKELDNALNLTGSNLYATYTIIGLNVIVFLLMILNGAGFFEPDGMVHLRWGSNFAPLTLSGDWWRLITSTFIHFGAIHLTMNMYCLYSIATYLEPLLGKQRYITAYLCCGALASLVSLWWHTTPANSAGASGAVFGMYGVFLAFLVSGYIPSSIRQSLLRSIGIFVIFNLAYGMKSGVDNAAHVGGLLSGFVLGYGFVFTIKDEKENGQKYKWMNSVIVLVTLVITFFYIQQHKVDDGIRQKLLSELHETSYRDFEKFNKNLKAFDRLHNAALNILSDSTLHGEDRFNQIKNDLIPKWDNALQLMSTANNMDISAAMHNKANAISKYIVLRKQQANLLMESAGQPLSIQAEVQQKLLQDKAEKLYLTIVQKP